MPKNQAQPVNTPGGGGDGQQAHRQPQEPLSGSKKVKNRNHSNRRYGEGS
ncbi:small acid-soluble spore protein P [Paenibacillus thalictri]|uniref:Small acid-soluble spore protein P n=1 Tax=Paenibacillus thalictri TaxID=2527873 RepID=A0A4Q9DC34_9BACL|nr:small acid-soluble spore protein P [Paenibacillus thalictri]TBL67629.1 small acid-soluble spore protein P [Paenibacillus thalictri]